jgi:hypothetical protein
MPSWKRRDFRCKTSMVSKRDTGWDGLDGRESKNVNATGESDIASALVLERASHPSLTAYSHVLHLPSTS